MASLLAKISHSFRESNRSADVLAKAALDSSLDFISFTVPLDVAVFQLHEDSVGVKYPRALRS